MSNVQVEDPKGILEGFDLEKLNAKVREALLTDRICDGVLSTVEAMKSATEAGDTVVRRVGRDSLSMLRLAIGGIRSRKKNKADGSAMTEKELRTFKAGMAALRFVYVTKLAAHFKVDLSKEGAKRTDVPDWKAWASVSAKISKIFDCRTITEKQILAMLGYASETDDDGNPIDDENASMSINTLYKIATATVEEEEEDTPAAEAEGEDTPAAEGEDTPEAEAEAEADTPESIMARIVEAGWDAEALSAFGTLWDAFLNADDVEAEAAA